MSKLAVIDLFAGAGGLSLGFEQTGRFETKAFVEINYYARQTYRANRGRVDDYNDITTIDFNEIEEKYGGIDVVIGGPPCQGFSNANRQRNQLISGNNNLVKEFIRAIEALTPKAFVMENVKSIQSEKHKFFVSEGEVGELEVLGIKTTYENVVLGHAGPLSDQLVEFCNSEREIGDFLLDKEVLSKLNSLYRLRNSTDKMASYLTKHKKKFLKYSFEWDSHHRRSWNPEYRDVWNHLKKHILQCLREGNITTEFKTDLEMIVDIQKTLSKFHEIEKYKIMFEIQSVGTQVNVKVYTYKVFDYVVSKLRSLGYGVQPKVLKAIEFGVPQQRERCFIIGIYGVPDRAVTFPQGFLKEGQYYTIRDAIGDLEYIEPSKDQNSSAVDRRVDVSSNRLQEYLHNNAIKVPNHVNTDTRPRAMSRFKVLEPGQSFKHLDETQKQNYTDPNSTQNTVYLRLEYDKPSRTVVNVRKSMWIHPTCDRAVSIREAARLQSFPDSYVFKGTKDAQYQQVGNAVPPLLGQAVAEQILRLLGEKVENEISQKLMPDELCITI